MNQRGDHTSSSRKPHCLMPHRKPKRHTMLKNGFRLKIWSLTNKLLSHLLVAAVSSYLSQCMLHFSSFSSSMTAMAAVSWKHFFERRFHHLTDARKSLVTKGLGSVFPCACVVFPCACYWSHNLTVPKCKIDLFKQCLTYQGPKLWNNLPDNLKNCCSIHTFKLMYKRFYNASR